MGVRSVVSWITCNLFGFDRLWSVTPAGAARMVDFTVEPSHDFFVEDYLTHNCVDDPVNEQDMFSKVAHNNVYEYYGAGLYSRRQPKRNAIVICMTRWRVDDLAGRLQADAVTNPGADQWVVLKIPAVCDEATADLLNDCSDDPHIETPHFYRPGDSFSPRRWSLDELMRTKATITRKAWASLYLQSPTEEEGGILLREWWKPWREGKPLPEIEYTLQSYDTAFEEGETNDFSARTTWGVFKRASDARMCVILLERMKERLAFPDLLESSLNSYDEYSPDRIIIEKAASGMPLIQEMRKRGIPVTPIKPIGSKIARANASTILFEQGCVYYPEGRKWALEVIDECAEFPNSAHDDVCLTAETKIKLTTGRETRIISLRKGDWIATPTGPAEIDYCVCSDEHAEILEVALSNGEVLRGTANHPVYVPRVEAFIPLGKLTPGERLCSPCNALRKYATKELITVGIQTQESGPLPNTSTGSAQERTRRCIEKFGRTLTGRFLSDMRCTISMVTRAITCWTIWNVLPEGSTVKDTETQTAGRLPRTSVSGLRKTGRLFGWQRRSTFVLSVGRILSHIKQTVSDFALADAMMTFMPWGLQSMCVVCVQKLSCRLSGMSPAPTSAKKSTVGSEKKFDTSIGTHRVSQKYMSEHVRCVQKSLLPTMPGYACVPASAMLSALEQPYVLRVRETGLREPVYALKVKGNPVYYANGILVHNCDTITQALVFLRRLFMLETPADEEDEDDPTEYDPAQDQPARKYARRHHVKYDNAARRV